MFPQPALDRFAMRAGIVPTDGFGGGAQAIRRVFRDPLYTGWPEWHLVQGVKRETARRLTAMERRLVIGNWPTAQQGQLSPGTFNTASIERLNATFRAWMPALTRRPRPPARYRPHLEAAMFWTAYVYHFCRVHDTLMGTPAMAAGLTTSVWSVRDLLFCLSGKRESRHAILSCCPCWIAPCQSVSLT